MGLQYVNELLKSEKRLAHEFSCALKTVLERRRSFNIKCNKCVINVFLTQFNTTVNKRLEMS